MRVKGQNSVDKKSILQFGKPEERSILDYFLINRVQKRES